MTGRRILVNGAFGVLGRAVAGVGARQGARIAAVDLAPNPPAGLAEAVGEGGRIIGGVDLSDPAAAARAVESAAGGLGGLDALINVAGGFAWELVVGGDPATWDRLYTLNLKTCVNMCRAAAPHLIKSGGRIVNVGAGGAVKAAAGMGPYAASKGGVHRLTEALAEELKGQVAVNAVLPSIIDTPQNRADMPKADFAKWVAPEALATIMLFLASEAAGPITGALIPVNGGV